MSENVYVFLKNTTKIKTLSTVFTLPFGYQ